METGGGTRPVGLCSYSGPVTFVRTFLDRWRMLIKEITAFGVIGIVNTVLYFAVFNALIHIGAVKANIIATIVSTTTSYFMNRHLTFRHRARSGLRREYMLFFVFNGVGLVISSGFLGAATYIFGVHDRWWLNVVNVFAIAVATMFRFWSYRKWVFRHPEDAIYETTREPAAIP